MPNMNSLASILQGLNDQQLQMEMQNPTGQVPQFLVMSEMQRRQQMRAEAAPVAPAPVTTVADDIQQAEMAQQQPQPQGVAGLPQMASGQDAPGGVASFAGGGRVDENEWYQFGPRTRYPSGGPGKLKRTPIDPDAAVEYYQDPLGAPSYTTDADDEDNLINRAKSYMRGANARFKHEFNKARGVMTDPFDVNQKPEQDSFQEYADVYAREQARFPPPVSDTYPEQARLRASNAAPLRIETNGVGGPGDADPVADVQRQGIGSKMSGKSASKTGVASVSATNTAPRVGLEVPPMPGALEDPQLKEVQDYLQMVREQNPDMIKPMIDAANARVEANKAGRKDAANMALMQAGLGMMASKNPGFLGGVGEGGIAGLKTYTDQLREVNQRDAELQRHRDNLALAQAEAARGNFKTAADLANHANTQALTMHGHKRQERRDDITARNQALQMNFQGEKLDRQLDLEERKLKSIDAYRDASVRAKSSGASAAGGKEAKAALSEYNKLKKEFLTANKGGIGADQNAMLEQAHQYAYQRMAPAQRQHIDGMYSGVMSVQPQQKVLKLGTNGFYQ